MAVSNGDRDPVTPAADTAISLREYVDMRFGSMETRFHERDTRFMEREKAIEQEFRNARAFVDAALSNAQKAIDKAEAANERRFEGVNEFRAALSDAARLHMPRMECENLFKSMQDKINELQSRIQARDDRGEGKGQLWGILIGAVAIMSSFVAIFFAVTNASKIP